jgi:hypothetical protein
MNPVPASSRKKDVLRGLQLGLGAAVAFSAMVLAMTGLGRTSSSEVPPIGYVVAAYFGAGVVGGVVFGLLRPITRTRGGATILGCILGTIIYASMYVLLVLTRRVELWAIWLSPILGSVVGGISAQFVWARTRQSD